MVPIATQLLILEIGLESPPKQPGPMQTLFTEGERTHPALFPMNTLFVNTPTVLLFARVSKPIITFPVEPGFKNWPAEEPTQMLSEHPSTFDMALPPMAMLFEPVVFAVSALRPIAMLYCPVVFAARALQPTAVLPSPWFFASVFAPMAVQSERLVA
jgi:hypothetical protein